MDAKTDKSAGKCPFAHSNRDWWPDQLNLNVLRQRSSLSNPMGKGFHFNQDFVWIEGEAPASINVPTSVLRAVTIPSNGA